MNNKYLKIGLNVLTAVIILIAIYFTIVIINNGNPAEFDKETLGEEQYEELAADAESTIMSAINFTLYLIWACGILAIGFAIYSMIINPKRSVKAVIGVAVFLVLLGIAYLMADGSVLPQWQEKFGTEVGSMSLDSAAFLGSWGIIAFFLLTGIAVAAIVVGEIAKYFK